MALIALEEGLGLLTLGLKRFFSSKLLTHGNGYFVLDYVFQFLVIFLIGNVSGYSGLIDSRNLAWGYWPWYLAQWGFVGLTWAYGYTTINLHTPRRHLRAASLRLAFCSISALWFIYDGSLARHTAMNTVFFGSIVLSAFCHQYGAYNRLRQHQRQHELGIIYPWDKTINDMTGSTMQYLTPTERSILREKATIFMTSDAGGNEFWYHPLVPVEGSTAQDPAKDFEASCFSRCYCCLDSDSYEIMSPQAYPEEQTMHAEWEDQRRLFLSQPSHSRRAIEPMLFDLQEMASRPAFKPHVLCDKCNWMCSSSYLIALQRGWTFQTFRRYLTHAFSREPLVEECFEHHLSTAELRRHADGGCHLCSLMWKSMSEEQQEELLSLDTELALDLESKLLNLEGEEAEKVALRLQFRRKRAIRVKIQSPWAQRKWAAPWRLRYSAHALRMIPHFGEQKLARRWMKNKFARCAISIDQDPVFDWDQEHVDAIAIQGTNNRGPIVLPLSSSTCTDITMSFIKSWLQKHDHSEAIHTDDDFYEDDPLPAGRVDNIPLDVQVRKESILPSRLVEVGQDDSSIRIFLSSEISQNGSGPALRNVNEVDTRYVALSHCWGSHKFATLTQSTLAKYQENIPADILARTFHDAILVTRRLGLRFLWIDSLCIIQDSYEDWRREAATMKDVYTNAYFVLATVGSWDSRDGIFAKQDPLNMSPCLVATKGYLSGLTGNVANSFGGVYAFPSTKFTSKSWEDVRLSRLKTRAWCFQEETLAKKIIYFGDHQVILRCKEPCNKIESQAAWVLMRNLCDDPYPNLLDTKIFWTTKVLVREAVVPYLRQNSLIKFVQQWKSRRVTSIALENQPREHKNRNQFEQPVEVSMKRLWWKEVLRYSSCFLTNETDKLEALAGVALSYQLKALEQRKSIDYVAGLWQDPYLTMGLLWYVSRNRQGKRSEIYRAPSWSWASVDGSIENNSTDGGESFELSRVDILEVGVIGPAVEDGEDRFVLGVVTSGFLRIRGVVRKGTWQFLPPNQGKFYVGHQPRRKATRDESDLGGYVPFSSDSTSGPAARVLLAESGEQVGYLVPDTEEDIPTEIYCLRIVVEPEARVDKEDFDIPWVTRGLALVREGHASMQYRRVGYIEVNCTHGGVTIPGTLSLPWRSSVRNEDARSIRWPPPNLDVNGFFDNIDEEELVIV